MKHHYEKKECSQLTLESVRQEIIKKITLWLDEIQNTYTFIPDDSASKNIYIRVSGRSTGDIEHMPKYFIEFQVNQDHFWLSPHLSFTESDKQGFNLSTENFREKIMIMLKMPLLSLNLGYDYRPSPENFKLLEMKKLIYFDGFSKNVYFDAIDSLLHGYEYVLTIFNEFKDPGTLKYDWFL